MKQQKHFFGGFKKGDFLIFGLIAAVIISSAIGFYKAPLSAHTVKIYVDSQEYATYVISEGFEKNVTVKTDYGYNLISVQSGQIQITESDCPGHDCIHMGSISQAGDMLVCLPHKLLITLEGGDSVDAVSY